MLGYLGRNRDAERPLIAGQKPALANCGEVFRAFFRSCLDLLGRRSKFHKGKALTLFGFFVCRFRFHRFRMLFLCCFAFSNVCFFGFSCPLLSCKCSCRCCLFRLFFGAPAMYLRSWSLCWLAITEVWVQAFKV